MVAAEVAIYEHLKNAGLKADVFAGLSLGEYSALVAAGAMTLADGIKTVRKKYPYAERSTSEWAECSGSHSNGHGSKIMNM